MSKKPVLSSPSVPWDDSLRNIHGFTFSYSQDVNDWSRVRYVLIDQHSGSRALPGAEANPIDNDIITRERDAGLEHLISHLLRTIPGGLAVHATVSRVYCDLNRRSARKRTRASDSRYFLKCLESHTSLEESDRLYSEAKKYYDSFRGAWQAGRGVVRPSKPGLLQTIHEKLGPKVFFWDLHTLDRYGPDGSERALFQAFSSCREDESPGPDRELIPRELCDLIGEIVGSDSALGRLAQETPRLGDFFRIDDPYFMYEGSTAEQTARRRYTIVTEIRKDLATDEGGKGLDAAKSVSVRILERVLGRLQTDSDCLPRFRPRPPFVSHWSETDVDRLLRIRQELFLDPMGSNRERLQEAAVLLQRALFDWYLSRPGEFRGMFSMVEERSQEWRNLREHEIATLRDRRFAVNRLARTAPAVESAVSVEQWQEIYGSLGAGFGEGRSFDRFLRDLDSYTNPSLRINHRYLGELLPHDNMVSYLSSMVATFLNENAIIGKVSPCVTHMEQAVCAWLARLVGWEGLLEIPDDTKRLPLQRLPTPFPPAQEHERWSREQPSGTIVGGGTVANISALLIARNATLNYLLGWGEGVQRLGPDVAWRIIRKAYDKPPYDYERLGVLTSIGSHYSVGKAALVAGVGAIDVRQITGSRNPWILDGPALERELRCCQDEKVLPIAVVALAGKTETGYVDDIRELADVLEHPEHKLPKWEVIHSNDEPISARVEQLLREELKLEDDWQTDWHTGPRDFREDTMLSYLESKKNNQSEKVKDRLEKEVRGSSHNRLFLHVDAAHGGAFLTVPALRHGPFQGVELADSITVDGHKMFYCYYPCGGLLSRTTRWTRTLHSGGASYISEDTNHYAYVEDRELIRNLRRPDKQNKKTPLVHHGVHRQKTGLDRLAAVRERHHRPSPRGTELEHLPFVNYLEGSRGSQGIMQLYFNLSTIGRGGYQSLLEWTHLLAQRCQEAVSVGDQHVRTVTEAPISQSRGLASLRQAVGSRAEVEPAQTSRVVPVLGGRLLLLSQGLCNQLLITYVPEREAMHIATQDETYWNQGEPAQPSRKHQAWPPLKRTMEGSRFWRTIHYLWRVNEHLWFKYLYANPAFAYYVGHTEFKPILPGPWPDGEGVESRRARLASLLSDWNLWTRASRDPGAYSPFFRVLANFAGENATDYVSDDEGRAPLDARERSVRFFCHKIVVMHPYTDESLLSDLLHKISFWGERSAAEVDQADQAAFEWLRVQKG